MSQPIMLSDFFARQGITAKDTLLIRHPWNHIKQCLKEGLTIKEFTKIQKKSFHKKETLWLVFVGEEKGTSARFYASYINKGFDVDDDNTHYKLDDSDVLSDLSGRLVIDWGAGTRTWAQNALNEKNVISIHAKPLQQFPGYQYVKDIPYDDIQRIIEDKERYADWHTALSSIKAIYLIVNHHNGMMYVGSAYGSGGLLGRWQCYIDTKTGGNLGIDENLKASPEDYKHFHFSILQVISPSETEQEIIRLENTFKEMLLTRRFGMNKN